jgi:alpha-2-macroglobulin
LVLWALAEIAPQHPKLAALARGLMAARTREAWGNTLENAWALLALHAYDRPASQTGKTIEMGTLGGVPNPPAPLRRRPSQQAPHAIVYVDAGGGLHGVELSAEAKSYTITIPLSRQAPGSITLTRDGSARVFYSLVHSQPTTEDSEVSRGLHLSRTLRRAEGVLAEPWSVRPGEIVALDVRVSADEAMRDVAVDVPLPAGLEPIHTDLRGEAGEE